MCVFLVSLNYFRAVAILIIVAGHCYGLVGIPNDTLTQKIIFNLVIGGTSLFVFISGFLFHHIFLPRYHYKTFIKGKIKNVLIPYLLLSIPIIYWITLKGEGWAPYYNSENNGVIVQYLVPTIQYLWSGNAMIAYWYIPFIMITFLMAPIHRWFAQQSTLTQFTIILFFLAISVFLHRPIDKLYVFQSVLYFFPIYLIGIFCSIHKAKIYAFMKGRELYLLFIAIYLAAYETFTGGLGNYHKMPFIYQGIDIMLFQKIALSLFFMVWLHRFEETAVKSLDAIAATSFGIFFLHGYLIYITDNIINNIGVNTLAELSYIEQLPLWFILSLVTATFMLISVFIVTSLKKAIPKHSRYLTGY
jgi:hypothetical protein